MKDLLESEFAKMELTGLPLSFFEDNRNRFFSLVKLRLKDFDSNSLLVLKAGDSIPKYDTDVDYYYFFQEANFYYLTGVKEPSLNCVVDFKDEKITLFYHEDDEETKVWQKVITTKEIEEKYGLKTENKSALNDWILKRDPSKLFVLEGKNDMSGLDVPSYKFDFSDEKYKNLREKVSLLPEIYNVLKESRKEKTPKEIELMKFICKVSNQAHIQMMKEMKPDQYERDIENIFNNFMSENFYTRIWGYPCIGACGVNAATLHYEINTKKILDGELFLADMGMRFCNYVSDVTITVPVNGKFTKKQKDIYDLCLDTNRTVMKMVKPGVNFRDLDTESKRLILVGLQKLDLISQTASISEMMENRVWYYFMPHGLGHHVGIEVHDVTTISYLGADSNLLREGNIITIEPGIYFREFLLKKGFEEEKVKQYLNKEKLEKYFDFGGVRIEDDVLVTKDSFINMNEDLPRTTEEIEAIMKK